MFNPEILIRKGSTINRFRCFAIMMNNIPTLNYETRYYSMKWRSFVMKFYATCTRAFLPCAIWKSLNQGMDLKGDKLIDNTKTKLQLPVHKALKFSADKNNSVIKGCNYIIRV